MTLSNFFQTQINGHECYVNDPFMIIQNVDGKWNAYNNGSSIQKIVIRQDVDDEGNPVDVLGAKEYDAPEQAAEDCI